MAANPVAAVNPGVGMQGSAFGVTAPGTQGRPIVQPLNLNSKSSSAISRLASAVARVQGTKRNKNSIDLFMK